LLSHCDSELQHRTTSYEIRYLIFFGTPSKAEKVSSIDIDQDWEMTNVNVADEAVTALAALSSTVTWGEHLS